MGRDRASRAHGLLAISLVTSLVLRPMIVVFGLGTRLHVHMHTTLENGVLRNGQQPECCEWLLSTKVKLKPIDCTVPCCDKDQFRAKMMVST